MLLEMINNEPKIDSYKKAPHVGAPYVEAEDDYNRFHMNNPAINQHVRGYREEPVNNYVKELWEKAAIFRE